MVWQHAQRSMPGPRRTASAPAVGRTGGPATHVLALQRSIGNRATTRLLTRAHWLDSDTGSTMRFSANAGQRDQYRRTYKIQEDDGTEWTVAVSSGHGYRVSHLGNPSELFGPDITQAGSMDEIEEAILADLDDNVVGDATITGTGRRRVSVGSEVIQFDYNVNRAGHHIGVGSYYIPDQEPAATRRAHAAPI